MASELPENEGAEQAVEEQKPPLDLDVQIESIGACQRHITVTVPRSDIERYFDEAVSELMPSAQVPGFRPGHAPRALVERRFKKEVKDQVKGTLLMDSVGQVTETSNLAAISEPDFDPFAIELPDEGPMTFEFDLEVRPEFDLPDWKGLTIERPVREFSDEDIDLRLRDLLTEHGRLAPHAGPAELGDYVAADLTFKSEGETLAEYEDQEIRIRPVLSLRDATVKNFGETMTGVKSGETRDLEVAVSDDAPNEALRGQTIQATVKVLEVKRVELPEMTPELLETIGDFENEAALRETIQGSLQRQLDFKQQQGVRQQVTAKLVSSADWDLPPEMLQRQANRELERKILELQRSGFSPADIRAHANELRQNSRASTASALKEHFILERIAEEENIEETPEDFDVEISLIAMQSGESVRRVRAQVEKRGWMDALRNQIIERKVIEQILEHATYDDKPYDLPMPQTEALDLNAAGGDQEGAIPSAKYDFEETPTTRETEKPS